MTPTPTKPTVVEKVPVNYQPSAVATPVQRRGRPSITLHASCFGKGTPVRTLAGPKAIETIEVGDLVLTQDTAGGTLGYRPVVMAHHNPPSPTFDIKLDGESIVTSYFHRFWVAGRGWVMARDLEGGRPRSGTLGGVAKVAKIELPGAVQLVFNLKDTPRATPTSSSAKRLAARWCTTIRSRTSSSRPSTPRRPSPPGEPGSLHPPPNRS